MVTGVEVDPKKELQNALKHAERKVSDLTIPLTLIAQNWFKSNRAIFTLKSQGKYADLSTKSFFAWWEKGDLRRMFQGGYKEYKAAKWGFTYPILKATGRLEKSITDPAHQDSVNKILNRKILFVGSATPYANFLHAGTRRMPARPVVIFGNEQVAPGALRGRVEIWKQIVADYAVRVAERAQRGT